MLPIKFDFKKIPIIGHIIDWLDGNDMEYGVFVAVISLLILYFAYVSSPTLMGTSVSFFFALAPIWLIVFCVDIFHMRWMDYVGRKFYLYNGRTLFRLKLPPEVLKSPEAMEFVFTQICQIQNPDNLMETYLSGKRPQPIGLEMVSIGGDVRFYVNLNSIKAKQSFIPTMYSQYPGVELIEEPVDYAGEIEVGDPDWDLMSFHMGKKEKKYGPIKSYIDFGLDKMPKEEEKVDPLTPMIERLADIGPNERLYIQFIITAFRRPNFKKGQLMFGEGPDWTKAVKETVDEMMQRDPKTKAPKSPEGSDFDGMPRITPGERDDIDAIERHISKPVFSVGMRFVYLAKKGHFSATLFNPVIRTFAQYDKIGRATIGVRWRTDFNYMFLSDPFGDRLKTIKKQEHKEYKLRKYVHKNLAGAPKFMTTEELATIFHLPGKVAVTPAMSRIQSTRSSAPSNLPVGDLPRNE